MTIIERFVLGCALTLVGVTVLVVVLLTFM
jgi:hypothetical protein